MTRVGELLAYLDERVPFSWAEPWDRVGLLAGDPHAEATGVLVSLDPTLSALDRAIAAGANVLLTHHPAFLEPIEAVCTSDQEALVVFRAVSTGIALVNCHTNLDRAPQGADALAHAVDLRMEGPLEPPGDDTSRPRAGRICAVPGDATLATLADAVAERLSVRPRVWGDPSKTVRRVGLAPGSGGSLVDAAVEAGCDALLTGELRYHGALAALERGLLVIEAGHDATEWPLTAVLHRMASEMPGIDADRVVMDRTPHPWWVA